MWNFPSQITVNGEEKRFILEDGYKYSVSLTVWPKQETYDTLADLENTYGTDPEEPIFSYDEKEKVWNCNLKGKEQ